MRFVTLILLLVGLTACGPLNEGQGSPQIIQDLRTQLFGGDETPTPPAIPPEVANAAPGEVLLVTLRARNAVAPLLKSGQNGSKVTWASPGQVAMTFDSGILISTRGLGDDLMGADVPGLATAIRGSGGIIRRQQSYLNSLDQIEVIGLTCQVVIAGLEEVPLVNGPRTLTKVTESCESNRLVFENIYWLNNGQIIKSQQVISPTQGFITAELL